MLRVLYFKMSLLQFGAIVLPLQTRSVEVLKLHSGTNNFLNTSNLHLGIPYWFLIRILYLFRTVSRKNSGMKALRIYNIVIADDLNIVIFASYHRFLKVFCMFLNKVILYGQNIGESEYNPCNCCWELNFFNFFFFFRITCNHLKQLKNIRGQVS